MLAELGVVVMCKVRRSGGVLWWLVRGSGATVVECGCRKRGAKCTVLDRDESDERRGYIALRLSRVCSKGVSTNCTYVGALSTECLDLVVGVFISRVAPEWLAISDGSVDWCSSVCSCTSSFTENRKEGFSVVSGWEQDTYVGKYFCYKKRFERIV